MKEKNDQLVHILINKRLKPKNKKQRTNILQLNKIKDRLREFSSVDKENA